MTAHKRYQPVGKCIYCGSTGKKLTDEHIIAFGLNANSILPDASCEDCNKITSNVEGKILRGLAWQMRTFLGFQTRRSKDVPNTFPLGLVKDGKEEIVLIWSKIKLYKESKRGIGRCENRIDAKELEDGGSDAST